MKSILNKMRQAIEELPHDDKMAFYELLSLNITICFRGVWSAENLSELDCNKRMKWLNEFQHFVVKAVPSVRLKKQQKVGIETEFIERLENCIKNCPEVKGELLWAIDSSYKSITK